MITNVQKGTRRAVAIPTVLTLGAALALSGCSSASSQTPDEIFKSYVAALNEGEIAAALELLADPGEITLENTGWFEELAADLPEPKLRTALELDDEIESTTLPFDFVSESPFEVTFVKVDGDWKISEPLFFVKSAADEDKEWAAEGSEAWHSRSTWWEVFKELEVDATLPGGGKFDFPEYVAGIATFREGDGGEDFFDEFTYEGIPLVRLTLSDLPDWEYFQSTPFGDENYIYFNNGRYMLDVDQPDYHLQPEILEQATNVASKELTGDQKVYSEGYLFNTTEYTREIGEVQQCSAASNSFAPELNPGPDYVVGIRCELDYTDSQFPGETDHWDADLTYSPITGAVEIEDYQGLE